MNILVIHWIRYVSLAGLLAEVAEDFSLTWEQAFLCGDILKVGNYKGKGWDILSHETGMILQPAVSHSSG